MSKTHILYCDGACSGNPGPGGWAWVCISGTGSLENSGCESDTTNNRMELKAAIEGLKAVEKLVKSGEIQKADMEVRTDSQYVKNGVTKWINSWKRNGWKTSAKTPVKNRELWEELDALSAVTGAEWTWVEGHSGEQWNEYCDKLAKTAAENAACNNQY